MKITLYITAFILLLIVTLAIIGYRYKKEERKHINKYNEDSIKSFMEGHAKKKSTEKANKYKRKNTPKVPRLKKT